MATLSKKALKSLPTGKSLAPIIWAMVGIFAAYFCFSILRGESIDVASQPYPDSLSYADGAVQVVNGNGFKISFDETRPLSEQRYPAELHSSRYPPGMSMFLSPFVRLFNGNIEGAQFGSKVITITLVLAVVIATGLIAGPFSSLLSLVILYNSPFIAKSAQLVMGDAMGALVTVAVFICIAAANRCSKNLRIRNLFMFLAGAFAGFGIITRTNLVIVVIALILATFRKGSLKFVLYGILPFLIFLGTYQWTEFGSPTKTGYSVYVKGIDEFSLAHITQENISSDREFIFQDKLDGRLMQWTCPCDKFGPVGKAGNWIFYPSVLAGIYWFYYPPLFGIIGMLYIFLRRRTTEFRFAEIVIFLNLVLLLPYFYQGVRLASPSAYLLVIASSSGITALFQKYLTPKLSLANAK